MQVVCGELKKVNEENVNDWLAAFNSLKSKFAARDIFNIDESGIFFNLYPQRTLSVKGDNCHGATKSKESITAVFTCNADGSEKLPLWIIGKSKNPRCFKNINLSKLKCEYTNQQNSWIDSQSFRKWLLKFNSKIKTQNRKILLTMDNCSAHDIKGLSLSNITVFFFHQIQPVVFSLWIKALSPW